MPGTRKLGRKTDHRMAMLRNLVTSFLESGKISTTVTRAKEVRRFVEKMITKGKKGTLASRREVVAFLRPVKTKNNVSIDKYLFDTIAPKYKERQGGYTRIIKLPARQGDSTKMAILELV